MEDSCANFNYVRLMLLVETLGITGAILDW
jgi:hypothetical protein